MARIYSRFNSSAIGTGLELLEAGRVVTTESSALSINRSVLSTLEQSEFDSYAEFIVYSATSPSIANKVSIGVCHVDSGGLDVDTQYVGEHAESVGYRVAEGEIHVGGSSVQSVTAGALGSVVGILLTWGATPSVSFFLDGALLHTEALPAGLASEDVYYAVSLGSTDAGDILVWHNTGARRFEHPSAVSEGWWTAADQLPDFRLATRPYLSASSDDYPAVTYDGDLLPVSAVLSRSISFWPSGRDGGAQKSALVVTVHNPEGRYNALLGGAMRDAPMTLQSLLVGEPMSAAETLGTFVFERAEAIGEDQLRLTFLDDMTLLERSAQRRYFRPDAESNVANAPWPTTIGACFSVEPPCYDIDDLLYAVDSEGASNVGKVRDKGDPLDQYASPTPDYVILSGGQAVQLENVPLGTVTVDASATGTSYVPPSPVDELGGDANPWAGALNALPTNWTITTGVSGDAKISPLATLRFRQDYAIETWITHDTAVLEAGKSYRMECRVESITGITNIGPGGKLYFAQETASLSPYWSIQGTSPFDPYFPDLPSPGDEANRQALPHTFVVTYSPATNHGLHLGYIGNNIIDNGLQVDCKIAFLNVYELPPTDTSATDDAVENALPALDLTGMVTEIMGRAGISQDYWSAADTEAIDAAPEYGGTGYRGSGWHADGQWVPRAALNDILAGYSSAMFKDENGLLRFTRLKFPEDETATATLRKSQMLTELLPAYDDAPGLTNTISCRKNWRVLAEGELVTDEVDVTMALRRKLARGFRHHRGSGAQLASGYEHAEDAPALETMLVDPADAQAEAEYIVAGFARSRAFYTTSVTREDCPALGAIVSVYYDAWGLSMTMATKLRCVAVEIDLTNEEARSVVLWGLSPEELES